MTLDFLLVLTVLCQGRSHCMFYEHFLHNSGAFFFLSWLPVDTDLLRNSHDVNKTNNLERLADRLLHRRSEEAGRETIESSRFSPPAVGLFVLPPVIMEDISSKWNFSGIEALRDSPVRAPAAWLPSRLALAAARKPAGCMWRKTDTHTHTHTHTHTYIYTLSCMWAFKR